MTSEVRDAYPFTVASSLVRGEIELVDLSLSEIQPYISIYVSNKNVNLT